MYWNVAHRGFPPRLGWSAGGGRFAVSLMVPVLSVVDVHAAVLHRRHVDWRAVRRLLPTSLVGMAMGQSMGGLVSDASARVLAGAVLLGILALRARGEAAAPAPRRPARPMRRAPAGDCGRRGSTIEGGGSTDGTEADEGASRGVARVDNRRGGDGCSRRNTPRDVEDGGGGGGDGGNECATRGSSGSLPYSLSPSSPPLPRSSRRKKEAPKPTIGNCPDSRLLWVGIVGIVGGASTMITNSMGPIVNVYLLSVEGLPPRSYVGTRAAFFCFVNVIKIPMRAAGGTLGMTMVPLACSLSLVAAAGVCMAKPIMLSMNERTFVVLELGVVAFAGLRLCYLGLVG